MIKLTNKPKPELIWVPLKDSDEVPRGSTLRCTDTGKRHITFGQTYKVLNTFTELVAVRNNQGNSTSYFKSRFSILKETYP